MAYIGKQPSTKFSAAAKQDSFTGDGSTVTFDVSNIIPAGGENGIQVYVDNVRQKPGSSNAYTIGNDGSGDLKRITFTAAPDASAEIYVIVPYEATNIKNVPDGTITNEKIADGAIDNAAVSPSAAISDTKLGTISTSGKVATSAISQPGSSGVYLAGDGNWGAIDTSQQDTNAFNIGLLGFKMAVNDGLTVFNLVDGVVDEFNDESGTDEAEGSNDLYNATDDYYINSNTPSGISVPAISAGFSMTAITEPDTSTTGTNPTYASGSMGSFTVPSGLCSVSAYVWGAGGGSPNTRPVSNPSTSYDGGGGGFTTGCLAVTSGQTLHILAGEGNAVGGSNSPPAFMGGGANLGPDPSPSPNKGAGGGGLSGIFAASASAPTCLTAPQVYFVAGSGGGASNDRGGGGGGGLTGYAGHASNANAVAQTSDIDCASGGGGDQEQGGARYNGIQGTAQSGAFLEGGDVTLTNAPSYNLHTNGGGGAGYFGGGSASRGPNNTDASGGGGSSYYGHPQVTCGATEDANSFLGTGGGTTSPFYVPGTNNAASGGSGDGDDGYVLLTAAAVCAAATSTTITSEPFASGTVPTSSRIVVFEENVDTPTLNTDIIASVSRDAGVTFTAATLSDSGYVTGSSGQRILTGQADISGQPSGQSMRWKLALANNQVKIHGVSLQWS